MKMIDLSGIKSGQIHVARIPDGSVIKKNDELFGLARSIAWKKMTVVEKEGKKTPHWSTTLEENKSCQIGTFGV